MTALKDHRDRPHSAVSLLARTLDERLGQTMDHLFQLLSIRYPAKEMQWTYLALSKEYQAACAEHGRLCAALLRTYDPDPTPPADVLAMMGGSGSISPGQRPVRSTAL